MYEVGLAAEPEGVRASRALENVATCLSFGTSPEEGRLSGGKSSRKRFGVLHELWHLAPGVIVADRAPHIPLGEHLRPAPLSPGVIWQDEYLFLP